MPSHATTLQELPIDLLLSIIDFCDVRSLASLACTSTRLAHAVRSYLPQILQDLDVAPIVTLPLLAKEKRTLALIQHGLKIATRLENLQGHAEVLYRQTRKSLPVLTLSSPLNGLLCSATSSVASIGFSPTGRPRKAQLAKLGPGQTALDDITSIAAHATRPTFFTSHVSGSLQRCTVQFKGKGREASIRVAGRLPHARLPIEGISHSQALLAAVAKNGRDRGLVSLYHSETSAALQTFPISARPWSIQLAPEWHASNWLAVGQKGTFALQLYAVNPAGVLTDKQVALTGNASTSAVYSIACASQDSGDTSIYAGFYDGVTRMYDVRSGRTGEIAPVRTFADRTCR
jgi:hypothetical protein